MDNELKATCRAGDGRVWAGFNLEGKLHRGIRAAEVNEVLLHNSNGGTLRA